MFFRLFTIATLLVTTVATASAQSTSPWELANPAAIQPASARKWISLKSTSKAPIFRADMVKLKSQLAAAPLESPGIMSTKTSNAYVEIPNPEGGVSRFRFVESPIMEPALAKEFPDIKTFLGQGVDDPTLTTRFDITPAGFHASVFSPKGGWYVDPAYATDTEFYTAYRRSDLTNAKPWQCFTTGTPDLKSAAQSYGAVKNLASGATLRNYRLACSATGEYTAFHGGTVPLGQAAIVTSVNRVNQIYEADLAIRLLLVANNSSLIYTNGATDPFTNDDPDFILDENQTLVDLVIGDANYDVGHVVSTGSGGLAAFGVCRSGIKAQGTTGTGSPIGDPFDVDYLAHELGHQFTGRHSFNGPSGFCAGNRDSSAAYEPGSGSTIMAYAGICGADDLQSNSDPYFHGISRDNILTYVSTGSGSGCSVNLATGNTPPTVNAGSNYAIPTGTPFTLTATGSDANGDSLTYCWEQFSLGATQTLAAADNGASPLFRSFSPTSSPSRTFPRLANIINNTASLGEKLPTVARAAMPFRVTVRDNRPGGGGASEATMQLQIVNTGSAFAVTAPNTAISVAGSTVVTWNVAGTTAAPISTSQVNILLSTDGGNTFNYVLAAQTENDGTESVVLPALATTTARVKVEAVGNVYWDMSNANFTITSPNFTQTRQDPLNETALQAQGSNIGWSAFGMTDGALVQSSANTTNLSGRVFAHPTKQRVSGAIQNKVGWLPFNSLLTHDVVRGKFFVRAATSTANNIDAPNLRMRMAARSAINSMLEVFHYNNDSTAQNAMDAELRPSLNASFSSLYRVDLHVPFVNAMSVQGEGAQAAFEAFTQLPNSNGTIFLDELVVGRYPLNLIRNNVQASYTYAPSASDAGNLQAYNTAAEVDLRNLIAGAGQGDPAVTDGAATAGQLPTTTANSNGVTLSTINVPTNRIGVAVRNFNPGLGGTNFTQRFRAEENRHYLARFQLVSTRNTNVQAQIRMRARSIKFGWSQKYELGGAQAAGAQNNTIALQVLPGIGCLITDKEVGDNGGYYNLVMATPMSLDIRPDLAGTLATRMPNITGQPGPGVNLTSRRDIVVGLDILDTISGSANANLEQGVVTVKRITLNASPLITD